MTPYVAPPEIRVNSEIQVFHPDDRNRSSYGVAADLGQYSELSVNHLTFRNPDSSVLRVRVHADLDGDIEEFGIPEVYVGAANSEGQTELEIGVSHYFIDEESQSLILSLEHELNTDDSRAVEEFIRKNTIELIYRNGRESFKLNAEINSDGVTVYNGQMRIPVQDADWLTFVGGFRAASADSLNYWSPELYIYADGLIGIPVDLSESVRCLTGVTVGVAYQPTEGSVDPRLGAGVGCEYSAGDLDARLGVRAGYGVTVQGGLNYRF